MTQFLPTKVHGKFKVMAQGEGLDYELEAFHIDSPNYGHMITIITSDGPIYITEEQAIAFFGW